MPRIALLHYWLTNMRGGENVLAEFCRLYPDAEIFTHAFNAQVIDPVIANMPVHETLISRLPGARRGCQKYLPLMPFALSKLDLSNFDLLISSESGPIKGVRKPAGATHICYCHSPMRYLWDMYGDYYRNSGLAGKIAMGTFKNYLRKYDLKSAESVDHFIANSSFVADRIKRIYGRESTVIHPPCDSEYFSAGERSGPEDYYLFVGQLIAYKRPDLAVDACRKLGRKLIIAGDGNVRKALEKSAASDANIQFAGRPSREKLRELYARAKALLFPGVEDFGIVPIEAQAAGTPVIALGKGGALETVRDNETGLFFKEETVQSLIDAITEFEAKSWDIQRIRAHAEHFNPARFRQEFSDFVKKNS